MVVFSDAGDPLPLLRAAGLGDVVSSGDVQDPGADAAPLRDAGAVGFPALGIAVVAGPEQLAALREHAGGRIAWVTPELVHTVRSDGPTQVPAGYLHGYRDGVTDLTGRLLAGAPGGEAPGEGPAYADTDEHTWGLVATGAATSPRSGAGVRVAVLDTGFDLAHPDFAGRAVTATSFVPGEEPQDGHGHGTHCAGTACGPLAPEGSRRYGVAHGAELYIGKVLSDEGSGTDAEILAGIDWAITSGCRVISMSLGADTPDASPAYTAVGQRALDAGCLVVAAAGNNAARGDGEYGFVGAPANSPSILAVAALDSALAVADFSARSTGAVGGEVDVAGPGVGVYSSWPMPTRYETISGTSMATPHVAGLAALWSEATGYRGRELWSTLTQQSRRLLAPSVDVGSGLVLAPQ